MLAPDFRSCAFVSDQLDSHFLKEKMGFKVQCPRTLAVHKTPLRGFFIALESAIGCLARRGVPMRLGQWPNFCF